MMDFKERMKSGEVLLGAAIETPEPDIAEFMSTLGFDWFWIDMEHCPLDIKDVQTIMQVIGRSDVTPIVRVPWNDPVYIKRVLDVGAVGVIVPWINDERDAEAAVRACRYPPHGIRGCGPRRPVWYEDFKKYVTEADGRVIVIVQIETREAIRNLRRILSTPGVDGTMVGPVDLSASLGHLGEPGDPEVQRAIKSIVEAHKGTDVCPGIASDPWNAQRHIEMGFRLVNVGSDMRFMEIAARDTLRRLRRFLEEREA